MAPYKRKGPSSFYARQAKSCKVVVKERPDTTTLQVERSHFRAYLAIKKSVWLQGIMRIKNAQWIASNLNRYLEKVPDRYREDLKRILSHKVTSNAKTIKAKCQSCVGFEDTAPRIRECTVYTCPLWGYRPYQIDKPKKKVTPLAHWFKKSKKDDSNEK